MTPQQTLQNAIDIAVKNGWKDEESLVPWRDSYGLQKFKSATHLKEFDVEHIIFNLSRKWGRSDE